MSDEESAKSGLFGVGPLDPTGDDDPNTQMQEGDVYLLLRVSQMRLQMP